MTASALDARAVDTIEAAVEQMRAIDDELPARDGVRAFNQMYLTVTEAVQTAIADGFFRNSEFLARLDVVFANRYFAAVRAAERGERAPRCWEVLWEHRADEDIAAMQFAVAGMNAHINHDLVIATVDARGEFESDTATLHADFVRVNALLARLDGSIRRSFESGMLLRAERWATWPEDHVCSWSISAARGVAWDDSEVLFGVRRHPYLRDRYERLLDDTVALAGHAILLPVHHRDHACTPGRALDDQNTPARSDGQATAP